MMEDKRIGYINFYGQRYPMCMTVAVQEKISERYGGVEKLFDLLDTEALEALPHWANLMCWMIEGGVARVKTLAAMSGEEVECPAPITEEQIKTIVGWSDIQEYTDALIQAVGLGGHTTVETEDDEKNGLTTQGSQG